MDNRSFAVLMHDLWSIGQHLRDIDFDGLARAAEHHGTPADREIVAEFRATTSRLPATRGPH